jgi:hypothetical protein
MVRPNALAGVECGVRCVYAPWGTVLVLQFKASNYVLRNGKRRFYAQHHQLEKLRSKGLQRPNTVFYVFPAIGNTRELSTNSNVLAQSQILDAGTIPLSLGPPTRRTGVLRKTGLHYIDVAAGWATIRSEPVDVRLSAPQQLLEAAPSTFSDGITRRVGAELEGLTGWLRGVRSAATRDTLGLIILPPDA